MAMDAGTKTCDRDKPHRSESHPLRSCPSDTPEVRLVQGSLHMSIPAQLRVKGEAVMKAMGTKPLPRIASSAEWEASREKLLAKEKAATRARDALAAERRRLPMVRIDKDYGFEGPDGRASLLDLFDGRRQLIIYHFMFAPGVDGWPTAGCPGCSFFVDNVGHLAPLHARRTSLLLLSPA